jgi:hypothetical protein
VTRCLCCDRPLSPAACFDGWCYTCLGGLVRDALFLRDGSREERGAAVAWLYERGCVTFAKAVTGAVPFEETLQRLTDE